jgi:hypothetical protein
MLALASFALFIYYGSIQGQNVTSFMLTSGPTYDVQSSLQSTSAFQPLLGPYTNVQFPGQSGGSTEFPPIEGGEFETPRGEGGEFEIPPNEAQNGGVEKFEEQPSGECNELALKNASASGFESDPADYHPPSDAIDGDSSTWWSNNGKDPWLQIDLGQSHSICSVSIEWNKGDKREYSFDIELSEDGNNYEKVFEGNNNKGSSGKETYEFDDQTNGRYIKLIITGTSSKNGWISIQEINAKGQSSLQFVD